MNPDIGKLARLAAVHHGLFTIAQARTFDISDERLGTLVSSGWCERVHRGVYRVRAAPRSTYQRLLVGVWAAGRDACASHRAAGHLWGCPDHRGGAAEMTLPRGRSQRTRFGIIHGSLWLPPTHVTQRFGIPVTTAARTAFDLAGVVTAKQLERDVDDLLHRGVCTTRQLQQVFFALARRGRRGTVAMRERLEKMGNAYIPPASELERRGRLLVEASDLPAPRVEVHLGAEEWIGRVDLLWDAAKVVVELDGARFHGSASARDRDRVRDNRLMAAGWRVLRVTWDDLVEQPDVVVRWIKDALASAESAPA